MWTGFVSRGPAVGKGEIAAFEARCGFRLPADYRAFLVGQNGGGRPPVPRAGGQDSDWGGVLLPHHRFFSLGLAAAAGWSADDVVEWEAALDTAAGWAEFLSEFPDLVYDLDAQMRWCRGDGGPGHYPPELLPVGVGDPGDLLLLRLDGSDAGAAYVSFDPDGYCEWHCRRLAGSFADLLRDFRVW